MIFANGERNSKRQVREMGEEEKKDNVDDRLQQGGKEEKRKKTKKKAKKLIIRAMPIIAFIIVAMILFSCLTAVVQTVIEALGSIGNTIVNFFTGPQTSIVLNEEQIDELIKQIEATGIDLEDLELLR